MRIFVTGATGFIGSAIVKELIEAGYEVLGLARSDKGALSLARAGAGVHRGSLEDLGSLRSGAAASDGVIHTAYIHDFSENNDAASYARTDGGAIEAIGEVLAGSGRPLVVASGMPVPAPGHVSTEDDAAPETPAYPRVSERAALAFAGRGVRASVLRMPPTVHGEGDHGFVPALIGIARARGLAAHVGGARPPAAPPPPVPAGGRERPRGHPAERGRRRGRAVPGHRRGHRQAPERSRDRAVPGAGAGPFRPVRRL